MARVLLLVPTREPQPPNLDAPRVRGHSPSLRGRGDLPSFRGPPARKLDGNVIARRPPHVRVVDVERVDADDGPAERRGARNAVKSLVAVDADDERRSSAERRYCARITLVVDTLGAARDVPERLALRIQESHDVELFGEVLFAMLPLRAQVRIFNLIYVPSHPPHATNETSKLSRYYLQTYFS